MPFTRYKSFLMGLFFYAALCSLYIKHLFIYLFGLLLTSQALGITACPSMSCSGITTVNGTNDVLIVSSVL